MLEKRLLRIIDANFNRCKEGLRVVEDIFRFVFEDDAMRIKIRSIRHSLDAIARQNIIRKAILQRNSKSDLGRRTDFLEIKHRTCVDILYSNLQRAKESLRVLEESFKLISPNRVWRIKRIRYNLYSLEKDIYVRQPHVIRQK